AAHDAGDADLAATYLPHRDELNQHTTDLDSAVTRTRQTLDAARAALIETAGGPDRIVTERDIHDVRQRAQRADLDALAQARAYAHDLDAQVARAEAAAARAFAEMRA